MSTFWSTWVIVLAVVTFCISFFLLCWAPWVRIPTQPDGTTTHVWAHGVLREGVKRLPRWWLVLSFAAFFFAAAYVVLSVLDRGQGIDPSELQDIFNPFIRGDRARGGKGTGLGLAIVKRIAAQHGGSVELRNRSGGGLEARVCLPLGLMLPRDAV